MFFSIKQIKMMTLKVNIVILNTKAKKRSKRSQIRYSNGTSNNNINNNK